MALTRWATYRPLLTLAHYLLLPAAYYYPLPTTTRYLLLSATYYYPLPTPTRYPLLLSTLYPLPSTLYPLPSTLYPLPSTLYPLPSTLYPLLVEYLPVWFTNSLCCLQTVAPKGAPRRTDFEAALQFVDGFGTRDSPGNVAARVRYVVHIPHLMRN